MRAVRLSITFNDQLNELLDWGEQRFGIAVAEQKKLIVYNTIEQFLARYPKTKRREPAHGLCVYLISKTPFVVLYDFDDSELRVHFIFHKHADLRELDPMTVEW
jgi:plasmid stabilization system protein ParE